MNDPTKPFANSADSASPAPTGSPLHVDSDWKAQAQAERERLAKQESARTARTAEPDPDALPPAEFRSLVGMLASQAIMGLGTMGDEQGRVIVDLPGAKFAIDILEVLETKTKGNLTADEQRELDEIMRELKSRFVQVARLVTEQMARGQAVPGVAGGPAGQAAAGATIGAQPSGAQPAKPAGGASKLIIP
ncbi:MAG: DUF1844 domain-containing protein [Phycisphaerae bacterium]|nr:DUF1844 domain-containing protein [Phycisphaerae bacterium]